MLVFFGAGAGASWPPPEPLLVDPPLPEDDPPELEPVEPLEELGLEEPEDVAAFVTGGEGSGTNGSRVGRVGS